MNRHSGRPCSTVRMRRSSVMQMLAIVALAVILPPSLSAAQVQSTTGEFPELKDMPFSDRLRRIDERPEPG